MNESITCEEVLHLARHLHACMDEVVKSLQLLACLLYTSDAADE